MRSICSAASRAASTASHGSPQHLLGHRFVNPQTAKGSTTSPALVQLHSIAVVARDGMFLPHVAHAHHSSTPPAPQHTRKQRAPTPTGLRFSVGFHVGIVGNQGLYPFRLLPANVTGMVVANQDTPRRAWFAVPFAFANTTLHNLRSYFSSPVGVRASIERIG